jgi:cell wall-associated NlpC family hydrolase
VTWQPPGARLGKVALLSLAAVAVLVVFALITVPMVVFGGSSFFSQAGSACQAAQAGAGGQPPVSVAARNSIPANYLAVFQSAGKKYKVPWVILAGIGKVESDDGRSNLPGVHSGSNAFGAAGPMQIGIGGASGNTWGGAPVHPAGQQVSGVATDGDGDGIADVYDPADAIAGAAKYLVEHGVVDNPAAAIFAYNHLEAYVQAVLQWAKTYASGGFSISAVSADNAPSCLPGVGQDPNGATSAVIAFAEEQLGKPYQWGGTGPDAFDCSGLVMEAYRAAGIEIPRTSEQQWVWGPRIPASQVEPGDLVFFAGADGTRASPGHVGVVIGGGLMIEAYATGFPIRVASYGGRDPVGFTRPWARHGVVVAEGQPPTP